MTTRSNSKTTKKDLFEALFTPRNSFKPSTTRNSMDGKNLESVFWGAKEILRGDFKSHEYGEIILPFVVLRRIGKVLESTKSDVLEEFSKLKSEPEELIEQRLNSITKQNFNNKSKFDMGLILAEPNHISRNLKSYIRGFSTNIQDIFDNFEFNKTIDLLEKKGVLYQIISHFSQIDLSPEKIKNHQMGTIYENLIIKTSEASNEEAGDHFTPREVIKLMVNFLFTNNDNLEKKAIKRIYDPACGTGGMLSVAKEFALEKFPKIKLEEFGQELNSQSYAICKSDMLIKGDNADNIKFGNSLTDEDQFYDDSFHFMLSNPPFGVDWGKYEKQIRYEHDKGENGKFPKGLPRKSDGSLLFLSHMISKMKSPDKGGSKIAIILNGSPLFAGDAESGESNIRKWIIKNDWLEAIVALPDQMFYNTGIFTYLWIINNNKSTPRKGKVQLINAISIFEKMKTSVGNKRNEIKPDQLDEITKIYANFKTDKFSKIFDNDDFGYRKITVERPLKRNFHASKERIRLLDDEPAFVKSNSEKNTKNSFTQNDIKKCLEHLGDKVYKDYELFSKDLEATLAETGIKISSSLQKVIENTLSERDDSAIPQVNSKGELVADSTLRDSENISLKYNIDEYFKNEVIKFVSDAWIDEKTRDKIGYEIPFTKHFYVYKPLRSLEEIDKDLKENQKEISNLQNEVVGK
jgi:type I restriction enzyme M protein